MTNNLGPCPECKREGLVLERKNGIRVVNCWLCDYERPAINAEMLVPLDTADDDGGMFTTGPDY